MTRITPHLSAPGKEHEYACLRDALRALGDTHSPLFCSASVFVRARPGSEALSRLAKNLAGSLCFALALLKEAPRSSFEVPALSGLFGADWAGHPFRHRPLFWWRPPTEPDATRMIGAVCSTEYSGSKAAQRRDSFLRALQKSIPGMPPLPMVPEGVCMEVCCEAVILNKKRLDIVFQCDKTGNPFVLIEAKFEADLNNPLSMYEKYIKNKGSTEYLLVILGCNDDRSSKNKERGWHFAHWFDLLRHWETELHNVNDIDEDFSRLRASLWAKLVR